LDVDKIFMECIDKWASTELDDRISMAIDKIDDWMKDFDEDEKDILCNLMKRFSYYTYNNTCNIIKELSDESKERFMVSNDNSVISVIRKKDGKLGSSSEYMLLHRLVSGLSKNVYYDSLDGIKEEEWINIKNIVFVDDCSGTGKTFVSFLKAQKKSFFNKRIILIVVELMEDAQNYIKNYATQNGIIIEIIAHVVKEKAFKNEKDSKRDLFDEMSKRQGIIDSYIMGFEKTEALMAFYNNTPNNTLGLFWFPTDRNCPIFPRELNEKPGWKQISDGKHRRRKQQYEAKRE